ncbi:NACHT and WD domain-containing protein [Zalerion maritima]|uniref:GPI inositol-deacylase n=1 Tax=Zalerion maritima TaxID=339359 RepID=A0AAD5RT12_9PEZI|nr:NACHT and WD domain-containing protein [Zalerion maritima]
MGLTGDEVDPNVEAALPNKGDGICILAPHGESRWATAWRVDIERTDGTVDSYFMKVSRGDTGKEAIEGEYLSTETMHSIAPDFCPKPIARGTYRNDTDLHYYICNFFEFTEGVPEPVDFCKKVALLHSKETSPNGKFGFDVTTYNGDLPQDNTWCDSWEQFFTQGVKQVLSVRESRAGPHKELDAVLPDLYGQIIPRLLRPLESHGRSVRPAFIHGDLWYGNAAIVDECNEEGIVFDPAGFWGHNEYEMGNWRPLRNKFGKRYFDERFNMNAAAIFPDQPVFVDMVIEEIQRLSEKYPEGRISRQNTDRSLTSSQLGRHDTIVNNFSSLSVSDHEKGPLGLTTLFSPVCPVVDIVFIHGLGGGSRKTWSKSTNPAHFWPMSWLPEDQDFQHARIHTFGYKADWGERRQSFLSILDFAQALLGELRNNPEIRREHTRIILVGHSMGGCVAKKTYILARQESACHDLARRFHSMFFLGTPHRGSDLASILQNMLAVAWGSKPFVTDLVPNSTALTEINDSFRHSAADLHLWSFYETLPVKTGVSNRVVVEKYSATLGYQNEQVSALDADHRDMCKYKDPSDPNYRKVRNSLCTAVDMVRSTTASTVTAEAAEEASSVSQDYGRQLADYLSTAEVHENDLSAMQDLRCPGSCQWFTESNIFTAWRVNRSKTPPILWLTGRPSTGKSVLASFVVETLVQSGSLCSYYFFKGSEAERTSLSDCLRNLAYQMALQDELVLEKILKLQKQGIDCDGMDEKAIWRKLFVTGIFETMSSSKHVWVLDGLDECSKFTRIFRLLQQIPTGLRIFTTSRSLEEINRGLISLTSKVHTTSISSSDTMDDIRAYVSLRLDELGLEHSYESLADKIIAKSSGSFLWVRLVLQELESAYTDEDIEAVLNDIPDDLLDLYSRMLSTVESDRRRVKLAKSVLTWVTLASRPLTTQELQCAVKLDIHETPHNMDKLLPTVCGQLVSVGQGSIVSLIHETVREFLTNKDLDSELAVKKVEGHGRLAGICLKYLCGDALKRSKPPGFQRLGPVQEKILVDYASLHFAHHLFKSTAEDFLGISELARFLSGNVLSWVEYIAKRGDLRPLIQTATSLRSYLRRRAKYTAPVDPNFQIVDAWVVDMIRVAVRFQQKLLSCPSSIHCLIPPLCPSTSAIHTLFANSTRSIQVYGHDLTQWDDCIARIDFDKGQATVVECGEKSFVVGLSTGQISVYLNQSMQEVANFKHSERVSSLKFSLGDEYLAACGSKAVTIWDVKSNEQLYSFPSRHRILGTHWLGAEGILYATQSSELILRNFETEEVEKYSWLQPLSESVGPDAPTQPPGKAVFSSSEKDLFAVAYRGHPIYILDQSGVYLGRCHSPSIHHGVHAMVFNPSPDIDALVASSAEGTLVVFNPQNTQVSYERSQVHAHTLSCSPDGRSLVTGSSSGTIEVYDFDGIDGTKLTLIYRINAHEDGIRNISFINDGLRFIDVRGTQCRVWELEVLIRKETENTSDSGISSNVTSFPPKTVGMLQGRALPDITAIAAHSSGKIAICGKSNGEVSLYLLADGKESQVLYAHSQGTAVVSVAIAEALGLIVTADDSGRIIAARWVAKNTLIAITETTMDERLDRSISKLIINPKNDRLLVCSKDLEQLWDLSSGKSIESVSWNEEVRGTISHPTREDLFMTFGVDRARLFSWNDFHELTGPDEIELSRHRDDAHSAQHSQFAADYHSGPNGLVELLKAFGGRDFSQLNTWEVSAFEPHPAKETSQPPRMPAAAASVAGFEELGPLIRSVITVIGSTIYFVDIDLWICSLDLDLFRSTSLAKRHFFIPSEWARSSGDVLVAFVAATRDFFFSSNHRFIIVKSGLEFQEEIRLVSMPGQQSSSWKVASDSQMHRKGSGAVVSLLHTH